MLSDLSSTGQRVSTLNSHLGTGVREPRPHPLDPLSEEEIRAASKACRDYAATLDLPPLRFSSVGAKVRRLQAVQHGGGGSLLAALVCFWQGRAACMPGCMCHSAGSAGLGIPCHTTQPQPPPCLLYRSPTSMRCWRTCVARARPRRATRSASCSHRPRTA